MEEQLVCCKPSLLKEGEWLHCLFASCCSLYLCGWLGLALNRHLGLGPPGFGPQGCRIVGMPCCNPQQQWIACLWRCSAPACSYPLLAGAN